MVYASIEKKKEKVNADLLMSITSAETSASSRSYYIILQTTIKKYFTILLVSEQIAHQRHQHPVRVDHQQPSLSAPQKT